MCLERDKYLNFLRFTEIYVINAKIKDRISAVIKKKLKNFKGMYICFR